MRLTPGSPPALLFCHVVALRQLCFSLVALRQLCFSLVAPRQLCFSLLALRQLYCALHALRHNDATREMLCGLLCVPWRAMFERGMSHEETCHESV